MKKTLFLLAAAAALTLQSCNKEASVTPDSTQDLNPVPVTFGVKGEFGADVSTKTTAVTSLPSFYAAATTGTSSESSIWTSTEFSGTPGSTYTGGKFWPHSDGQYNFYASNNELSFTSGGTTVSATNSKDVICAYLPYNPESSNHKITNTLVFNHIFARIGTCTISEPDNYSVTGLTVAVTPVTGGTYNIKSGSWSSTSTGAAQTIANALDSDSDNNLYLVHGDYVLTANYTISRGDYSETLTKTATVTLQQGKINNISATLPAGSAQEIVFNITITSWTDNPIDATFE